MVDIKITGLQRGVKTLVRCLTATKWQMTRISRSLRLKCRQVQTSRDTASLSLLRASLLVAFPLLVGAWLLVSALLAKLKNAACFAKEPKNNGQQENSNCSEQRPSEDRPNLNPPSQPREKKWQLYALSLRNNAAEPSFFLLCLLSVFSGT